ncbi:MAG: hypothetical protein HYY04_12515 [Chloroflexi bacterium]|nr:hypothetical protein [Chloroflexota bacterium]
MRPLVVEIITYAPTEFHHCLHCEVVWREAGPGPKVHAEQRAASLPDDLGAQYQEIARWARDLAQRYGDRVSFRVVDAASLEGFVKSLRYLVSHYPAFRVGKATCVGDDLERVTELVRAQLGESDTPSAPVPTLRSTER